MTLTFIKETSAPLPDFTGTTAINFTRDPATTLLVFYFSCETGALDTTDGLKWAAADMTRAVVVTNGVFAHGEMWFFQNMGPGQTQVTFKSTGGATIPLWSAIEFSGEDIAASLVGVTGSTVGVGLLMSTPWIPQRTTSFILDIFRMKGKTGVTQGAGQSQIIKQLVGGGKSHGAIESATGSGPATWTLNKIKNFAHCLMEIKEFLPSNDATIEAQIGALTADVAANQEREATVEAQIGALTTGILGNQERKATIEAQIGALSVVIRAVVDRNATIDATIDPLTTGILVTIDQSQNFAQIEAQIGALTASLLSNQERRATVEAQIGALTTDIDAVVINKATVTAQIAALTAAITAHPAPDASVTAQIGALSLALFVQLEHDATVDPAQIGALTTTISANAGTATSGFDSESKVFLQTFDSTFTKLRARIVQNGTGGIRVPVDAHSVVIRRIT